MIFTDRESLVQHLKENNIKKCIFIGIIGSRRRDDFDDFQKTLDAFEKVVDSFPEREKVVIVSGGCPKGGDRFAEIIAEQLGYDILIHYPDKNKLDQELMAKGGRAIRAAYAKSVGTLALQ